jgi:pyridoxal phosphate enzyme (YggS family)
MTHSPEAEAAARHALAGRRDEILKRIARAAQEAGRSPGAIELVAISKRQPEARIDAALAAGQHVFGENRVQEAQARWTDRRAAVPDLELRLVGPLQSNKTAEAVALFDVIETLDREKLARKLREEMDRQGRAPRLYVQVNTGEEAQKSGLAPAETAAFVERMRTEFGFEIEGLMCIPPAEEPPGLHFALLARLARDCGVEKLSMGMSADYPAAVALGASSVRVGSALFGAREA